MNKLVIRIDKDRNIEVYTDNSSTNYIIVDENNINEDSMIFNLIPDGSMGEFKDYLNKKKITSRDNKEFYEDILEQLEEMEY